VGESRSAVQGSEPVLLGSNWMVAWCPQLYCSFAETADTPPKCPDPSATRSRPISVPRLPDELGGCLLCYRFIPACAGNTEVVSFGHPTDSGSSPLVLGTEHILFSLRRQATIAHGQQESLCGIEATLPPPSSGCPKDRNGHTKPSWTGLGWRSSRVLVERPYSRWQNILRRVPRGQHGADELYELLRTETADR
jgi:hypothetical protein